MQKRIISLILALILTLTASLYLASCDSGDETPDDSGTKDDGGNKTPDDGDNTKAPDDDNPGNDTAAGTSDGQTETDTSRYTKYDLNESYDADTATTIKYSDSAAEITGKGASADGTAVTITAEGTYILSGSCIDGQLIVEVASTEKVQLVMNGLKLICTNSAPLWIKNCDKTAITLVDGTTTTLQDGGSYSNVNADDEPNGCLFSKDDLTINGSGTLNVYGNYNNGIACKDDLKVIGGIINITSKNHGLRGNDSVTIKDGEISISCKNDGIKASNDTDSAKGYVYIEGGTITIDAGDDALQAYTDLTVDGGKITAEAGGKITNCDGTVSVKDGTIN